MLDHIIAEAVREDLAWKRGDGHPRTFPLQDVTEVFEVGVAAANGAVLQLEGGDVGPADDLVVGVHAPRRAVRLRVLDLRGRGRGEESVSGARRRGGGRGCLGGMGRFTSISRKFSGGP